MYTIINVLVYEFGDIEGEVLYYGVPGRHTVVCGEAVFAVSARNEGLTQTLYLYIYMYLLLFKRRSPLPLVSPAVIP